MLLFWNKDQCYNNPFPSFTTCLFRQMSGHEWTVSSSLHDTRTVNLFLVQCECHTGKQTAITLSFWFRIFKKYLLFSLNFQGNARFAPPLRTTMCLVLVLPNLKLHEDDKLLFDENGIEVFISKNCWNKFLSGICYLLSLPNSFPNPARKSTNC